MTAPQDVELAGLHRIAEAIRDEVEENAHTIDRATSLHPAYSETDHIGGGMLRQLVLHGARSLASAVGLTPTPAHGGWDLTWSDERVYRKYRIKKATKNESGEFEMLVGLNSNLLQNDVETLLIEEQWVLGYTATTLHTIDEIFAAEVTGATDSRVGRLVFGRMIMLGRTTPPDGGRFLSDDEDVLPGFEDDSGAGDAAGAVA